MFQIFLYLLIQFCLMVHLRNVEDLTKYVADQTRINLIGGVPLNLGYQESGDLRIVHNSSLDRMTLIKDYNVRAPVSPKERIVIGSFEEKGDSGYRIVYQADPHALAHIRFRHLYKYKAGEWIKGLHYTFGTHWCEGGCQNTRFHTIREFKTLDEMLNLLTFFISGFSSQRLDAKSKALLKAVLDDPRPSRDIMEVFQELGVFDR